MPVLAIFTALFALFHLATTIADYGFIPKYILDVRFGFDDFTGKVDLNIPSYLQFSAMLAVPFLIVYFLWRFWSLRKASVVQITT